MSLELKDVTKKYRIRATGTEINALNGVTLSLPEGKTLGIVGESGCGKSTLARLIVGLEQPTAGTLTWRNESISDKSHDAVRTRLSKTQLVFQDPYSSLNPRQRIGECIAEVIRVHRLRPAEKINERVAELLSVVGIAPDLQHRYPHQLSGGQRQRVSIARALAAEPDLLVLDEPVSALDVSVRADVMNLLVDLREKFGLTYLFISHDLSMIRHISDHIAVMYLGKVVEWGSWQEVLENAKHPYTQALIEAMPDHTSIGRGRITKPLSGEVPDPAHLPTGCAFHLRCPIAVARCSINQPELISLSHFHQVACPEVI